MDFFWFWKAKMQFFKAFTRSDMKKGVRKRIKQRYLWFERL